MENPRVVSRFVYALFIVATLAVLSCRLYFRNIYILYAWLASVGCFLAICG